MMTIIRQNKIANKLPLFSINGKEIKTIFFFRKLVRQFSYNFIIKIYIIMLISDKVYESFLCLISETRFGLQFGISEGKLNEINNQN